MNDCFEIVHLKATQLTHTHIHKHVATQMYMKNVSTEGRYTHARVLSVACRRQTHWCNVRLVTWKQFKHFITHHTHSHMHTLTCTHSHMHMHTLTHAHTQLVEQNIKCNTSHKGCTLSLAHQPQGVYPVISTTNYKGCTLSLAQPTNRLDPFCPILS